MTHAAAFLLGFFIGSFVWTLRYLDAALPRPGHLGERDWRDLEREPLEVA